nr:MAG TPA: hypothetical protein [Caudoviricetes sp.]
MLFISEMVYLFLSHTFKGCTHGVPLLYSIAYTFIFL